MSIYYYRNNCNILLPTLISKMGAGKPPQLEQLQHDLNDIEAANMTVAVDVSASNFMNNKNELYKDLHESVMFDGQSYISPYLKLLQFLTYSLQNIDDKVLFKTFINKTLTSNSINVVALEAEYNKTIEQYKAKQLTDTKGTQMGNLIYETIEEVYQTQKYTILIILTDGLIEDMALDRQAIHDASMFPISIIVFGVGDNNFQKLKSFDACLFSRVFDNLQFIDFNYIEKNYRDRSYLKGKYLDVVKQSSKLDDFDLELFEEICAQYRTIRKLGLLEVLKCIVDEKNDSSKKRKIKSRKGNSAGSDASQQNGSK